MIKTHFIGGLDEQTQIYFIMDRDEPATAHEAYLMAERRENSRIIIRKERRGMVTTTPSLRLIKIDPGNLWLKLKRT